MGYTDNNITFESFDGNIFPRIKKVGNNQNQSASIDDLSDIASDNGGNLPTIVNALEIDWNDADLGGAVSDYVFDNKFSEGLQVNFINTTGDLLNVIAHLQAEVTILSNLVKGLYKALGATA